MERMVKCLVKFFISHRGVQIDINSFSVEISTRFAKYMWAIAHLPFEEELQRAHALGADHLDVLIRTEEDVPEWNLLRGEVAFPIEVFAL